MPQNDAIFLQTSADALLHKIQELRQEVPHTLNPKAPPFTPQPSQSSTTNHCLVVTTAEVHPQPKEVPLNSSDGKTQPTEKEPPNTKRVRWQLEPSTIHHIEAEGQQKPTTATLRQQKEHASKKRTWCTNRSKRYRDQLVDWVITLHQLHALNSHSEPHCPSPRLILH